MCDTLCVVGRDRTLFAKNSDRPVGEVQVAEVHPRRPGGGHLRTQYLEIDDPGSVALLGSRPAWLWGFEHGVNEHGVAIGNEKVWGVDDPHEAAPALIGMDLVRLGLERGHTADEAVAVMTGLLEHHGQGGPAEAPGGEPYWSSFLVADAAGAWVLETSGRTWAAKRADDGAAISNRISLGTDWTRASAGVTAGDDFDAWRHPAAPTGHADRRLAATRACVASGAAALTPRDLVATMRHHGGRAWGSPGSDPADIHPVPAGPALPDGTGVTVCMHVRGYQATTASMVAELPADPEAPVRAWVALGNPCVSVYVPVVVPGPLPAALGDPETWQRFRTLADSVESDVEALGTVRAALAPVEADLWDEADALAADHGGDETRWLAFGEGASAAVEAALAAALASHPTHETR